MALVFVALFGRYGMAATYQPTFRQASEKKPTAKTLLAFSCRAEAPYLT
jgi:hypothetical protein